MRALHSLRPALPYDDIALLTDVEYLRLRDTDAIRGTLEDIWTEGGEVLGVWHRINGNDTTPPNTPSWIIKMSHLYAELAHRRRWVTEDLEVYRRALRGGAMASHYLERESALNQRPGGEIELFPEEANVGEFDNADDENDDFDEEADEDD